MRIIIEGCDGTGKSSVALKLAEIYEENILHMTRWGKKNFRSYFNQYSQVEPFISDRSFISEIVYSKVFNRDCGINDDEIDDLFRLLQNKEYKIVILICAINEIRRRLNIRNDESEDILKRIEKIQDEFMELAKEYHFCVINTTYKTIDEIVEEIQRRLLDESK